MTPRRHTAPTVAKARQLEKAGWSKGRIAQLLEVPATQVRIWTDPDYAARHREWQRRCAARARAGRTDGRLGWSDATPEFRARREAALLEIGLTRPAVAKVMAFDFGDSS